MLTNPFSTFANDLQQKLSGIQGTVDMALGAASTLKNLPFVGQQLGGIDAAQKFVDNLASSIQGQLTNIANTGVTKDDLITELYTALGPGPNGAHILGGDSGHNDTTNSSEITKSDIHVTSAPVTSNGVVTSLGVEMRIHVGYSTTASFTLGLPALPIKIAASGAVQVAASIDFELAVNYTFGVATPITLPVADVNHYSPGLSASASQLVFKVTAGFDPSNPPKLTANVGILQGTLTPTSCDASQNGLTAWVYVSSVQSPGITMGGNANVNLNASLGFSDGNGGSGKAFPSVSTVLSMNLPDLATPSSVVFSYNNVKLDLGQYFSTVVGPVLGAIQQYTKPIQDALSVLTTPIPGISSILNNFSLLSALQLGVGQAAPEYAPLAAIASTAVTIANEINGLGIAPDGNVQMPFGDFNLDGGALAGATAANMGDLTNPVSNLNFDNCVSGAAGLVSDFATHIADKIGQIGLPSGVASTLTSLAQTALAGAGGGAGASIDFPLFDNPSTVLNLLFGQDSDLVAFTGSFHGSASTPQMPSGSFSGFTVGFTASLAAEGSIKLGYDTYGLRKLIGDLQAGNSSPGTIANDVADGFYIAGPGAPAPTHLHINGSIGVGGGIGGSIGIQGFSVGASLLASAGLTANVDVTLNNADPEPNSAGKIRLSQIENEIANGDPVFNPSGNITAGISLDATASADLPLIGNVSATINIFRVPIGTFWDSSDINNNPSGNIPPPVVYNLSQSAGPEAGTYDISVYGANLEGNPAGVQFIDQATGLIYDGLVVSDGPTYIEVQVPVYQYSGSQSSAPASADVVVVTAGGDSATTPADVFTYVPAPVVTGIDKHSGSANGGTLVTISGSNLNNATAVDFGNNNPGSIQTNNGTTMTVYSPADPTGAEGTDQVDVTVTTPGGTSVPSTRSFGTGPEEFDYVPTPVVNSISPSAGGLKDHQLITITGDYFGNETTGVPIPCTVLFGKVAVPVLPGNDTPYYYRGILVGWTITVKAPSHVRGSEDVQVETTPAGNLSPKVPADLYNWYDTPVVTSVTPQAGPLTNLDPVTIDYTSEGGAATAVKFGGKAGTIHSQTEIDTVNNIWSMSATPPNVPTSSPNTSVHVEVTAISGTSLPASDGSDVFTYTNNPIVGLIEPTAGPLSGGTAVKIFGQMLSEATEVDFGATAIPITPADLIKKDFTIGNTTVPVIIGIKVSSPPGTAQVDVRLKGVGGSSPIVNSDKFTYTPAPVVSSVQLTDDLTASPAFGPYEGGTSVTITGTNLDNFSAVNFGPANPATKIISQTSTQIVVISPGSVYTQPTNVDVLVTAPGGVSQGGIGGTRPQDRFEYQAVPPEVDSVFANSGPGSGNTTITITGKNFLGATNVDFCTLAGHVPAKSFHVDSSTQITAVTPVHDMGQVAIEVETPQNQWSGVQSSDQFTFTTAPNAVSSVSPSSGPTGGGTAVTIVGTNLASATAVNFGGVPGTIVSKTGTQIVAVSPAGTAGTVHVTVVIPDGATPTSPADQFAYYAPSAPAPVVSSISPLPDINSVTIAGSNLSGITAVHFGANNPADLGTLVYNADGTITVATPNSIPFGSTVDVTVTTAGGTSPIVPLDQFWYGANTPRIFLLNLKTGPTSTPGFTEEIFGQNLWNVNATVMFGTFAGTIISSSTSGNEMTVTVPSRESATTVDVQVTTYGNRTSPLTSADHYTYTSGPVVMAVHLSSDPNAPAVGPATGGTNLVISGYHLSDVNAVHFNTTNAPVYAYNNYSGTIAVVSPAGLGTEGVNVTTPEGTSQTGVYDGNSFTYVPVPPVPTVSAIGPATGPLAGGQRVTIAGTFSQVSEVDFGLGNPGTNLDVENGYLRVTSPAGTAGTVNVTVSNAIGASATSLADQYIYADVPPPVVSGFSQTSGALEGSSQMTITGTNLANAMEVDFGPNNPATILSNTDAQILVISPGGTLGPVDVTVTTPFGTSDPLFTYTHAPFISHVSGPITLDGNQAAGMVAGGDTVTIQGNDLTGATVVDFGNTAIPHFTYNLDGTIASINFSIDSDSQITLNSPPGVACTVDITVTTPLGRSDISSADQFTYGDVPTITAVSPSAGSTSGGTQVLISGTNLAYAEEVDFGTGNLAASFTANSATQISATSPVGAIGTPYVTVVTPFGTSATSTANQFTYVAPPSVSSLDTTEGPVGGGTQVTFTGAGLANATEVDFGPGNPATIVKDGSNTDSQIVVITPEATDDAAGPVDVTVTTDYGTWTGTGQFNYVSPPTVTSVTQSSGPVAGGTSVTISGANLDGATAVAFGGITAQWFQNVDGNTIYATSPAGSASTVDVTVTTPGGTNDSSSGDQFTYLDVPSVLSVSPAAGPITGGTPVTIAGTDLATAAQVYFDSTAVSFTVNPDGTITTASPYLGYVNTEHVTVVTAGGTSLTSATDQFSYVAAPAVSGISTTSGFRSGGGLVTITGSNLDSLPEVDFGPGNPGTVLDYSASQIDVTSPPGATGAVNVTVITPGGSATAPNQFTYLAPVPAVIGLSQSVGPASGATITITGTDLDGATAVAFGGAAAASFTVDSSTQITATSPSGTVGPVDVTVTTPGGTSRTLGADQFTGISPPAVSAVDLNAGSTLGGDDVIVYGSGLDGATTVKFDQTAGTIVLDAATYIIAATPPGTPGTVHVTVTTPYGTSAASTGDQFIFWAPPSAAADSYAAAPDSTLTVAAPGVLANDTGPQGYVGLTAILVTNPAHGTLSLSKGGSFTYTPNSGYLGPDSFTYQAHNQYGNSAPTTVSITVSPPTLTWTGSQPGNWTDAQWSGPGPSYPDSTANAVIGSGSVVHVTSDQTANALAVQAGLQVAVGPGAVLSVTADTSVTGGGMLNVDPSGLFSTGGIVTLDSGGSLSGGTIEAAAYQLNDGTASANLSGPGGVTKDTLGTVSLFGSNSYAGDTVVDAGTLIVASASALPDGSSLVIGAGATLMFDPSQAVTSISIAGSPVPAPAITKASDTSAAIVAASTIANTSVTAPVVPTVSPFVQRPVANQSYGPRPPSASPVPVSNATADTVFASLRSALDRTRVLADNAQSARPWTWLAAVESSWNYSYQDKTSGSTIEALDKVLARFGL